MAENTKMPPNQDQRQRTPQDIRYTTAQLRRLRALACAAVGVVTDRHCLDSNASTSLDAALRRLSALAVAGRSRGDGDNYVLRRGALLHADVAMLVVRTPVEPVTTRTFPPLGPQRLKMEISDGQQTDFGQTAVHWEIARMVLDYVMPGGAGGPAPGRDGMVRQWYRATAAWMQQVEDHDTVHLDHAREIFPSDPDILFLSGAQRDTYASSHIQSAVRSAVLPSGVSFAALCLLKCYDSVHDHRVDTDRILERLGVRGRVLHLGWIEHDDVGRHVRSDATAVVEVDSRRGQRRHLVDRLRQRQRFSLAHVARENPGERSESARMRMSLA